MCGIVGVIERTKPADPACLAAMADNIAHRGPDGAGTWTSESIGFGNRRLKVLDLSERGRMPMQTTDGRYTITYNGEVYNFRELRAELQAVGVQFESDTDTEVVLKAWAAWGPSSLERLNGMFAFAIHDAKDASVILARDRVGIKPLYWCDLETTILFGSEIKSFMAHPSFVVRVDPEGLREYFTFQNILSNRTLFAGVQVVPAGHWMRFDARGNRSDPVQWWDLDMTNPIDTTAEEAAAEVRRLFEQAVRRQLVSDVPVGSFLSGGMDSGSLVAVASAHLADMHTITVGFNMEGLDGMEAGFDETVAAADMASHFGTLHQQQTLRGSDMHDVIEPVAWHHEDPRVGQCWQDYYATKLAREHVTVCLSGAGGDELFAGYPWRYALLDDVQDREGFVEAYYRYWQRVVPEAQHPSFFSEAVMRATDTYSPRASFEFVIADAPVPDGAWKDLALYFEFKTFLHGIMVMTDKIANAHSLEVRVPFLDNDLIDYASKLPIKAKLRRSGADIEIGAQGAHISNEGKTCLREAMVGLIPDEIRLRKKQGFAPPDESWFRGAGMLYLRATLLDNAASHPFIRAEAVDRILREHAAGENRKQLIWSLLVFEWWCRTYQPDATGPIVAASKSTPPTQEQ